LRQIAQSIPKHTEKLALILSDEDIAPDDLQAFRAESPWEILIENKIRPQDIDTYFDHADGLILDAEIRRTSALQTGPFPTIDMTRVEELINRLRKIVPVTEMDPDIFLRR
jgi:hypothetical protein